MRYITEKKNSYRYPKGGRGEYVDMLESQESVQEWGRGG